MKILDYVLNFLFIAICCVHVGIIVFIFINRCNPDIKVYEQELKDIEFPVAIILCVDKIENSSQEYKDVGYADLETFFTGFGKFNSNMGWGGHLENGSTLGTVESLLDQIAVDWSSVIQTIGFYENLTGGKLQQITDLEWSKVPLFPNCQVFDLAKSKAMDGKEVHKVAILAKMKQNYALTHGRIEKLYCGFFC